jgi:hypothetical protein
MLTLDRKGEVFNLCDVIRQARRQAHEAIFSNSVKGLSIHVCSSLLAAEKKQAVGIIGQDKVTTDEIYVC